MRAQAVLAAASFALFALLVGLSRGGHWAPGEIDLLWPARAFAGGAPLPPWAAALHPDAWGTAWEAGALGLLLRLGLPDLLAFRVAGAFHAGGLALGVGLAARALGAAPWVAVSALMALPLVVHVHTRVQGTTTEIAGVQALLLALALARPPRPVAHGMRVVLLVFGLVLGTAWSRHTALIAPAALLLATVALRPFHRAAAVVLGVIAVCVVPVVEWWLRDPAGPLVAPFTVRSMSPVALLAAAGTSESWKHLLSLPVEIGRPSPAAVVAAPLVVLAAAAALRALRAADPLRRRVAWWTISAAAPLPLAASVAGWPEGVRWVLPALGPAVALLVSDPVWLRAGRARFVPLAAGWVATSLAMPSLPAAELSRTEASFVAAQHRLSMAQGGLHDHPLRLAPWVSVDEWEGFAMGWGLHWAREFPAQRQSFLQQDRDRRVTPERWWPPSADPILTGASPEAWWRSIEALPGAEAAFALGVGLGVAEDGELSVDDVALLRAAPPTDPRLQQAAWAGVSWARAERRRRGLPGGDTLWVQDVDLQDGERVAVQAPARIPEGPLPTTEPLRFAFHLGSRPD